MCVIPNRDIHDNHLITYEFLTTFSKEKKHNKKGCMAIKLDMAKSYDRLEWGFIKSCVNDLGFCDNGLMGSSNAYPHFLLK